MAFDISTSCAVVKTHIEALVDGNGAARFFAVDIAAPRRGQPQGPYALIHPQSMSVTTAFLKAPEERHVLRVEIHISPTARGWQEQVLEGARLTSELLDSLYGDFTLGGNVRNVDVTGIEVQFAERDIEDVPTRVAEITLPLIVDGTAEFAA